MQDKVLEILSNAKDWMTAGDVAVAGKYRSAGNVGLCLKNLGDRVVFRKSKTRKNASSGQPQVEWRHADKSFGDDEPEQIQGNMQQTPQNLQQKVVKPVQIAAARKILETEMPATADDSILRAQLKLAEQQRNDHYDRARQAEEATENWLKLAGEFECKSIPELRVFINSTVERVESAKRVSNANHNDVLMWERSMHALTGEDSVGGVSKVIGDMKQRIAELEIVDAEFAPPLVASEPAIDIKDAAIGYLVRIPKRKPRLCTKPESAREAALSGARAHGRADVLALVPVGKAVRGAEWKEVA